MDKEYKIGSDFEIHRPDFDLYPTRKKKGEDAKDLHGLEYMNLGFVLITPLILGVILGSYIDGRYHIRPMATIIFIMFGVVASFYNLFRIIKK